MTARRAAGFAVLVAGAAWGGAAGAEPWAPAGDAGLRGDVELLAAHGVIDGPVTAWPIPGRYLLGRLAAPPRGLPAHVAASVRRVRARLAAGRGFGGRIEARAATAPALVRGDDRASRREAELRAALDWTDGPTALRLALAASSGGGAARTRLDFDGSYAARQAGNWLLYAGAVPRWWGPGRTTSLVMSNNARPFPALGALRDDPRPFETRWLRWLGPWRLDAFVGVLTDRGRSVEAPVVAALRAAAAPARGLEVGASRVMQFCGKGRRCGAGALVEAFFARNENREDRRDTGNQQGGFDARWAARLGGVDLAVYGQVVGEDEAGGLPGKYAGLIGASATGAVPGGGGAAWRLGVEYADSAAGLEGAAPVFDAFCNHHVFRTGLRFHGRCLGPSLDNDSRLVTLSGSVTDARDRVWRLAWHRAELNRDGSPGGNRVSASAEVVNVLALGIRLPAGRRVFGLDLRLRDDAPNTPGRRVPGAAIEASWTARF